MKLRRGAIRPALHKPQSSRDDWGFVMPIGFTDIQ